MSYQIKRILVPVDFSETSEIAITQAVSMAVLLKAELFLLNVVEVINPYFIPLSDMDAVLPPSTEDIEAQARQKLESLAANIHSTSGIMPVTSLERGEIHEEIINYSKQKETDLIIMGTHGVSGPVELFIGSNAHRVVTLSDIPVLTLQKSKSTCKNILIPIDNSLHSREKVNIAAEVAKIYHSNVHIIGLSDSDEEEELSKFKIKLHSVEEIIREDNLQCTTTVVNGENLAKAALAYATENNCDLIVINTGHESRITGMFMGAFAQQIVNHSTIPVLSVRHTKFHFSIETPGYGI